MFRELCNAYKNKHDFCYKTTLGDILDYPFVVTQHQNTGDQVPVPMVQQATTVGNDTVDGNVCAVQRRKQQ